MLIRVSLGRRYHRVLVIAKECLVIIGNLVKTATPRAVATRQLQLLETIQYFRRLTYTAA